MNSVKIYNQGKLVFSRTNQGFVFENGYVKIWKENDELCFNNFSEVYCLNHGDLLVLERE